MKVYILSDMEGTAGISIWDQVMGVGQSKYELARQWMTEEINAAADGAFAAGAKLVLVNDSHFTGHNLDLEVLDSRLEYIMGGGKTEWTELDDSFDMLFLLGAHAKAGTPEANLRHTWSPANWADLRIGSRSVGEIGLFAAGAGDLGVPCALVSGDDKACDEAAGLIPGITQVVVKWGLGWQSARSLSLRSARDQIRQKAKEACQGASRVEPLRLGGPETDIEIVLLAEDRGPYYASSCEVRELMAGPLLRKRGSGKTIVPAFTAALTALPEKI